MALQQFAHAAGAMAAQFIANVVGAVVLWIVGRWLIGLAVRFVLRVLERHSLDRTLTTYVDRSVRIVLNVVLAVSVLGFFGVQTTTFAALIAAGGVAIGVAWSGLLSNLGAGALLIMLRPFKIGDVISAGGVTGVVEAIGLFGTAIKSADNVLWMMGNSKIASDTIQNLSAYPYRRVDISVTLANSADHVLAIQLLRTRIAALPFVLPNPEPQIDLLQLRLEGPVLCVRPWCENEHYWDVHFEANRTIREAFREAGIPLAVPLLVQATGSAQMVAAAQS